MPKPKQTRVKRNAQNFEFVMLKKCIQSFTDYVVKSVFFLMTCQLCRFLQWSTRSSGRTPVRSAQVEEGMGEREEESF